ncbi:MAG: hypothetical protein LH478_07065 [Chitinophagaceae bacterium]|nr:hypothetical protein [Chitinophagaceae bacterium]
MKYIFTLFLIATSSLSFCQKKLVPDQQISVAIGTSKHGTGDMAGIVFNTSYSKKFKKNLSWIVGIGGSIHDGQHPLYYTFNGNEVDGSIRYTTAGLQLNAYLGYDLLKAGNHQFQLRLGPLLRYQSSSNTEGFGIYYPAPGSGLPFPVVEFNHRTPQRTYTAGGSAQAGYNYTISKMNLSIGLDAGLQTDTNGDTITQLSLSVGKRF